MNKVILMGRLTRDPDMRVTTGENAMTISRYTLAVDRRTRKTDTNESTADFITCVAFGKAAEFAEKYFHQVAYRPGVTQTRTAIRYTQQTLLWKNRSLRIARQQDRPA